MSSWLEPSLGKKFEIFHESLAWPLDQPKIEEPRAPHCRYPYFFSHKLFEGPYPEGINHNLGERSL